jgi:hypothetical protein
MNTSAPQNGTLRVTKECSEYTGAAGSFCTIASSNGVADSCGGVAGASVVAPMSGHPNFDRGQAALDMASKIASPLPLTPSPMKSWWRTARTRQGCRRSGASCCHSFLPVRTERFVLRFTRCKAA